MKKEKALFILVFLFTVSFSGTCFGKSPTTIEKLTVEYAETPLSIDVKEPRFSWQMKSAHPGAAQTAYQLTVANEEGHSVWDSGKVKSSTSLNIRYAGRPLEPMTRYAWTVTVWNNKGEQREAASWFETGLMSTTLSAWEGAKWIGGSADDMVLNSHYLPVFGIHYSLQLDSLSQSLKAGFVFGANDARLMDKNMNILGVESSHNRSYFMLELDITPLAAGKEALLNLYRVGYHREDKKDSAWRTFAIATSLINNSNKYRKHKLSITNDLGNACFYIENREVARAGINPINQGGDYIAFPVVADIGYAVPANQTATFADIEIRNFRAPQSILAKEPGKTLSGGSTGVFQTHNPTRNSMPMLRTQFSAQKNISKARLYVTARGIYDFYVNGKRVTDNYFNPGSTQYNKTQLYQSHDVTSMLRTGSNAMGAMLAEGWWSGGATFMGSGWNYFGDRQSLLAKLVITYTDGSTETVVSNPETWQYFNEGPVVYGSFFQGEIYDARKEQQIAGWSTPAYDAAAWHRAIEIPLAGTVAFKEEDYTNLQLTGRYEHAVRPIKELTAQSVQEVRPGVFVYDMGQNMVGVPKINLSGMKPGQKINLRYAEVKYPDLPEYQNNVGMIMLENIRAAMSQDIY